ACSPTPSFSCPPRSPPDLTPLSLHDALPIPTSPAVLPATPSRSWWRSHTWPGSWTRPVVPSSWRTSPGRCTAPDGTSSERPNRRSEEHTSELQSRFDLVCRLLLEKKNGKHEA